MESRTIDISLQIRIHLPASTWPFSLCKALYDLHDPSPNLHMKSEHLFFEHLSCQTFLRFEPFQFVLGRHLRVDVKLEILNESMRRYLLKQHKTIIIWCENNK